MVQARKSNMTIIPFWLAVAIMILAAAILIVAIYFLSCRWPDAGQNSNVPNNHNGANNVVTGQTLSCVGMIDSIAGKSLVVKTKLNQTVGQEILLTVNVSDATKYSSVALPKTLSATAGEQTADIKDVSFGDLKVGDQIVVISQTDIVGKTEITATSIQKTAVK